MKDTGFFNAELVRIFLKLAPIFGICYPITAMPMSGKLSPTWGQEKNMARVVVKNSSGRTVSGVRVNANTTTRFFLSDYDRNGVTDQKGVCELQDGANRYHILVNGQRVETVGSLRGMIEVTIWPQGLDWDLSYLRVPFRWDFLELKIYAIYAIEIIYHHHSLH